MTGSSRVAVCFTSVPLGPAKINNNKQLLVRQLEKFYHHSKFYPQQRNFKTVILFLQVLLLKLDRTLVLLMYVHHYET